MRILSTAFDIFEIGVLFSEVLVEMAPTSLLNANTRNDQLRLQQAIKNKFNSNADYAKRLTAKYSSPPYVNEDGVTPEEDTFIALEAKNPYPNSTHLTTMVNLPPTRKRSQAGGRRKRRTHKRTLRKHKRNHRRTHRR